MKLNFVQKKGAVVALATVLSVGSFAGTALAGINFKPVNDTQSAYFQSNPSVNGLLAEGDAVENITLTKAKPSEEVNVSLYVRNNNQSTGWSIVKVSGDDCISVKDCLITATGNGTAVFVCQKGNEVVKTWNVTASGFTSSSDGTGGGSSSGGGISGGGGGAATTTPGKTDNDSKPGQDDTTSASTATIVTKDGKQVAVDKDGNVIQKSIVSVNGMDYVTNAKGEVVKSAFATTKDGVKVYARKSGVIVKSTTFTVNGKKYFADATGAVAIKKFVQTPNGNTVYAGTNGVIVRSKAFKVDGKQYVANKNGVVVKNRWVTIGKTKYYCNKKGVVTKTKAVKKNK